MDYKRLFLRKGLIITFLLATFSLYSKDKTEISALKRQKERMKPIIQQVKENLRPIEDAEFNKFSEEEEKYEEFYGLNNKNVLHKMGRIDSGGYRIAVQIFAPMQTEIKGTVLAMHGYMEHTGTNSDLLKLLLEEDYRVIAYDMPGHGLSGGTPASIKDFKEYSSVMRNILVFAKKNYILPDIIIAHSTGCSAVLQFIAEEKTLDLSKIILIAPLVRSTHWKLSKVVYYSSKLILWKSAPRLFPKVSNDIEFLNFLKYGEPIQYKKIPYQWLNALYKWEKITHLWKTKKIDVTMIFATADTTTDWKYNMQFLKKKFPKSNFSEIPNGRHALLNDSYKYRKQVFQIIEKTLNNLKK
ncbi:MAG: alpha/beta hydrolase [Verrucomicrobiota bacterium]|nr:alpha/beta hydrolase [Verrucomicrobiota bacterium]